jgi:4-diphosphocytidyl-2-C-methyl-D-erythritol kinase
MSGSGATCFGLYSTEEAAAAAAQILALAHRDWWVRASALS